VPSFGLTTSGVRGGARRCRQLEAAKRDAIIGAKLHVTQRGLVAMGTRILRKAVLVLAVSGLLVTGSAAQELVPRFYWPAPKGTKVVVAGYTHSSGDVLMDPSLPLYGVDSRINTAFFAYLQTFSLWGRTTNVVAELPYSWGTTKGILVADQAQRNFSGLNDSGRTLAINLLGAPTMTPADFQELRANPHPILGASVKVLALTGQYDKGRLINVGANRWAARAELGSVVSLKRKWLLELEAGA
jgi:hypothetical protein